MVMVIECEACQSRFRLAKSLFKESRAIRVRCRKCGGYIVVENPDLPGAEAESPADAPRTAAPVVPQAVSKPGPPPPAPVEEPEDRHPKKQAPEKPAPPPPVDETARAMADLLREIESETVRKAPQPPPPASELPPELMSPEGRSGKKAGPVGPVSPYPEPPDGSEALASVLEDLFKTHPASGAGPSREAAPPVDSARAAEPGRSAPPKEPARGRPERPPYARPVFIVVAVLWILLLAGAAFLFGTGYYARWSAGGWNPKSAASPANNAAGQPAYDISDVKYFTDNAFDGGKLFAVTGTVTSVGASAKGGIRIRATLVGKDNAVLSEKVVIAGNRIDNTMLRHTKQDVIESFLTREAEVGSVNREIGKGESVPFMAVFFDPPERIESVLVKAVPPESR